MPPKKGKGGGGGAGGGKQDKGKGSKGMYIFWNSCTICHFRKVEIYSNYIQLSIALILKLQELVLNLLLFECDYQGVHGVCNHIQKSIMVGDKNSTIYYLDIPCTITYSF